MPGAKRRALKKLLSPHSGPKESHHQSFPTGTEHSNVDPIAVPTLSHSPVQSVDGLTSTTTSLRDLSVSPLPPSAADQGSVELQLVDEMQNRENVIGSGHASLASSPSNTLSPPAATPSSGGGYTVDDLLNAGADGKGKKKSSKQRFLEREVSGLSLSYDWYRSVNDSDSLCCCSCRQEKRKSVLLLRLRWIRPSRAGWRGRKPRKPISSVGHVENSV
jgi:hypothetical protein